MALYNQQNSKIIDGLYKRHNFRVDDLKSDQDLHQIPMLGVTSMKHYLITTREEKYLHLKLTSSGTSQKGHQKGQKTQIWFDQESLDRAQAMMTGYFQQEGWTSEEETNYLIFTYDPEDAKDLGIAYSDKNMLRFAPVADQFYAIKKGESGKWYFDKKNLYQKLKEYSKDKRPIRIFGMPAFIHQFLEFMEEEHPDQLFNFGYLHPDTLILTGGGWKSAEEKKITREEFRGKLQKVLGIPVDRIRDGYGMAEHVAPYFECSKHRFHIPVFCRIIIRDPVTLKVLPEGSAGLMQLVTPFNTMMPNLSILTTDWGKIDKTKCPCGYNSPTFTLLGRAGTSKYKGCAISAGELIR